MKEITKKIADSAMSINEVVVLIKEYFDKELPLDPEWVRIYKEDLEVLFTEEELMEYWEYAINDQY